MKGRGIVRTGAALAVVLLLSLGATGGSGAKPDVAIANAAEFATVTGDSCFTCWWEEYLNVHTCIIVQGGAWQGNYHEGPAPGLCSKHEHTTGCSGPQFMHGLADHLAGLFGDELKEELNRSYGVLNLNLARQSIQVTTCDGRSTIGNYPLTQEQFTSLQF